MKNIKRKALIGVIGGSGLYDIDGLTQKRWQKVASQFGEPSDELLFGTLDGVEMVFLPRHGRGHVHSPSEINYRANIDALKSVGVSDIISVSAVGSLREELSPGAFVVVDQYIDRTYLRKKTFFGTGNVAHVSMAHPVCSRVGKRVFEAGNEVGLEMVNGGVYLVMEGPQFSTLAESRLYRTWGCDVIGMTNMPEAKLAREAAICYSSIAMVTDYDCWHPNHDNVTVEQILKVLESNASGARSLIKALVPKIKEFDGECSCRKGLSNSLITNEAYRDIELVKKLEVVTKKFEN